MQERAHMCSLCDKIIISLLSLFKLACETSGIYVTAAVSPFYFFTKGSFANSLHVRL